MKLPSERVSALVAEGVGKPFDPGHGRLMTGWLTLVGGSGSWAELPRESLAYVSRSK